MFGLNNQVGGGHYKTGIQPFVFSAANGHDACTHAIQKYLTRFRRKAGIEDLMKAHHICYIRLDLVRDWGAPDTHEPRIKLAEYLRSNQCCGTTAAAICAVERWFRSPQTDHPREADACRALIRDVAQAHYPDQFKEEDFL